jgi:hypothetical protein
VSGVRQDAWANAHRIPVEEMKSAKNASDHHPRFEDGSSRVQVSR